MEMISKAIDTARYNVDAPTRDITGDNCSSCACENIEDFSALSPTHPCIASWDNALKKINHIADITIDINRDLWGNPFFLYENEGSDRTDPGVPDEIVSAGKDKIIGTAFFIKLLGSASAIFFIFITSFFVTNEIFTLILIWLFSLNYIPQAFNVIETYFQSQVSSKKIVKAQVIAGIISAVLKISVIFLNKGIFWLL
jgi:hypothetical protein